VAWFDFPAVSRRCYPVLPDLAENPRSVTLAWAKMPDGGCDDGPPAGTLMLVIIEIKK